MQRDIYIFMGPPGAGKGTLSERCVKDFGWKQLSTGSLCREHIAQQTEIGQQIDFIIKSGRLISDSLIIAMVEDWLAHCGAQDAVILDGFPRTIAQAQALNHLLQKDDSRSRNLKVVHISVDDEILIKRLALRMLCTNSKCQGMSTLENLKNHDSMAACPKCSSALIRRPDDEEDTVRERLSIYHEHAKGLLEYFTNKGHAVVQVPGELSVNDVFMHFKKIVGLE